MSSLICQTHSQSPARSRTLHAHYYDADPCRLLLTTVWGAKVRGMFLHTTRKLTGLLKVRVKCSPDDTVGDLKRLIAAQTGTDHTKIQLKKWCVLLPNLAQCRDLTFSVCFLSRYTIYKDHITLADYEIHDGMSLEMY